MLDLRSKIDLVNTDPYLAQTLQGGVLPDDTYLNQNLGNDYKKYTEMRRDSHIRRVLNKRKQSILGRRVIVESGNSLKEKLGVEKAEKILKFMRYESLCSALLNTGQLIGFAVLQLDWELKEDLVVPTFKFVPQNRFTFVHHKPDDKTIPTTTGEDLDLKTEIIVIQGHELRLLTRAHPIYGERCPKKRFLVYTFDGDGSPWGLGLGYSVYPWYVVKREAIKAWLLHSDRMGSPPIVGTHPPEMKDADPIAGAVLRKFESFLKSVSPNGWARLPNGFQANILESLAGAGSGVHEQLIATANAEISMAVLGEVQFSDKLSGSYAANVSQVEDREASLIDADVNILDEQAEEQLWTPIAEYNYPPSVLITVRRETIADARQIDLEMQQEAKQTATVARDDMLINKLNLRPSDQYIQETYGQEWSFGKAPGLGEVVAMKPRVAEVVTMSEGTIETVDFANAAIRHVYWNDLDIGIEFEPGHVRFGKTMRCAYGYISRHLGADGDALDCYLGPDLDSTRIFRVRQVKPDGVFDEYKYMLLFRTPERAAEFFKYHIPSNRYGGIEEVGLATIASHYRLVGNSPSQTDDNADYAEAFQVDGDLLPENEFDAIAQDQTAAIQDAKAGWQAIAPDFFKSILVAS